MDRRTFIKLFGASTAFLAAGLPGVDLSKAYAYSAKMGKLKGTKETTSICPFCAVGCGLVVRYAEQGGKRTVVNVEGDPDHPINQGALCSKGNAVYQIHDDPAGKRLKFAQYRAPGSKEWKQVSLDWALDKIAKRVKSTRDKSFLTRNQANQVVNRTEAIACLGGAALDNEECYLLSKAMRSLGVVYLEHQARL